MDVANQWKDYTLIDCAHGEKLERWKDKILLRPDPQIIWDDRVLRDVYEGKIDAHYHRSSTGGGYWENLKQVPSSWKVHYKNLTFCIKQMGFKHTGLFPEQAVNWDFMMEKIEQAHRPIRVLNLFAYTGGASVACLSKGASVVHVDSSKGMVDWCRENVKASHLENCPIRYIVDDVVKFVAREIRRGNKYDAIIMDPPSYGRGANKEVWNIEKDLGNLVKMCTQLLSDQPLFFLINCYTTGMSPTVLSNLLKEFVEKKNHGITTCGEIGLPIEKTQLILPCGIYGRWSS